MAWFFQRKINRNANQLKKLRAEKKKIIEQVMDKETYKVACEILNRFGDASTRAQHQPVATGMLFDRNENEILASDFHNTFFSVSFFFRNRFAQSKFDRFELSNTTEANARKGWNNATKSTQTSNIASANRSYTD